MFKIGRQEDRKTGRLGRQEDRKIGRQEGKKTGGLKDEKILDRRM